VDPSVSPTPLGCAVKLKITIDGKTYAVDVEAAEADTPAQPPSGIHMESAAIRLPAAQAPPPQPDAGVHEEKVCRSPVSGIVVRIAAQIGQKLQVGDILLVLEAMKMETNITSAVAGQVAAIKVAAGESVQAGQVVVEFEP
jgi:methylmalonyl-CoA carboxyltransferase 1.3S subunit